MLDLSDLTYRGEGNNNIVLSDSKGMIYRIRKSPNPSVLPTKKTRAIKKRRHLTVLFGQNRMAHYFGSNFVHPLEIIEVDSSILKAIDDLFRSKRPAFRLNRGVDLNTRKVLTAPDATRIPPHFSAFSEGPTICVEIKPKFGAVPCGHAEDQIEEAVRRNAIFCIMQYHENKLRMWGQPSSYCPCDLFSGNRERMLRALWALLAVRQNNLRIFRDSQCVLNNNIDRLDATLMDFFCPKSSLDPLSDCGQPGNFGSSYDSIQVTPPPPVAGEDSSSDEDCDLGATICPYSTCHCDPAVAFSLRLSFLEGLIIPTLLAEIPSKSNASTKLTGFVNRSANFRYDCDLHPFSPSNDKRTAPRSIAALGDIAKASPLGRIYTAQMESSRSHKDLIDHYEIVSAYFKDHEISWDSYIGGKVIINPAEAPPSLLESLNLVEKHLVAMVARDCSIMLTFRRATKDCPRDVFTLGDECQRVPRTIVDISIVDLDPKDLSNLQERVESERRVVERFLAAKTELEI